MRKLFENEIEHPSFGMIHWNKVQGTSRDLYGSSIEHSNTITLEISESKVSRDLNRDWYYQGQPFIEIEMSPNQFSEFLTSPNTTGVPCTIRYIKGIGPIEGLPIESKRKQFEKEFESDLQLLGQNFDEVEKYIDNMKLSASAKKELTSKIFEVRRIFDDYIPFAQKSFNEQMDNTVTEAKATIEAFVESKIRSVGLEAIAGNVPVKLLENNTKESSEDGTDKSTE